MKLSLEQLSARMRQGETIPLRDTAGVVLMLSIPSILEQIVVTAMEYIDAAMVGHIGAEATAAIGIVSSSTWLLHGILVGLYNAFSIQIAQYLGADRQQDARGVLRQAMLFNLAAGLTAAAFGIGISGHLPGWLGADVSLQANASAYFAIWSAALPFTMAMGMYTSMLRASGDALTPGLISVLVCAFAAPLMGVFIDPAQTGIIAAGVQYLRIEGACYIGIGVLFLLYGYYRAVNQPGMSVILTIASLGTRVALAYLLSATPLGVTGIWLSVPIGWALADAIGIGYYLKKNACKNDEAMVR